MSQPAHVLPPATRVSMRHLYLYTHMLLADVNKPGRNVRIEWRHIRTAQIGPDPLNPGGLLLVLPIMAAQGTDEDAELLTGLISHEIVCHGLHTDFRVEIRPGLEGALQNIIEDPRGERLGAQEYPGSPRLIHRALQILVSRGIFQGPTGSQKPPEILASWLVCELRSEILKQSCLAGFATEYRQLALATFGAKLVDEIKALAVEGCFSSHTQGAADASFKIVQLLKQHRSENQPGNDAPDTQTSNSNSNSRRQAIEQVLGANQNDLGPLGKGLEDVICGTSQVFSRGPGGYSQSHTHEMLELTLSKTGGSATNRTALRAGSQMVAARLSLGFADLVEAHAKTRRRSREEGVLNQNLLWRIPFGDLRVFTEKQREPALNTAFYLLVDESSSMASKFGPEIIKKEGEGSAPNCAPEFEKAEGAAAKVAVAVGEVLTEAEIPFGVASYNTSVREWHAFDDSWADTLLRFAPSPSGNTNTHLAVAWALKKLIYRPEERKILIVITDGDPGNASVLESALTESAGLGIEVRFVLIGARHKAQYSNLSAAHGVALNPAELASAVFGALKSAVPSLS